MSRERLEAWIAAAALTAALGAGSFLYVRSERGRGAECSICERPIHVPTAFSLEVEGRTVWGCCPRCGLSIRAAKGGAARDPVATDFSTGARIPAERCVYVEGSDLAPCCSPRAIVLDEKICCERCFDRCFPSAIAFADAGKAREFQEEHGGKVIAFEELLQEVRKP